MNTATTVEELECSTYAWCEGHDTITPESEGYHNGTYAYLALADDALGTKDGQQGDVFEGLDVDLVEHPDGSQWLSLDLHMIQHIDPQAPESFTDQLRAFADQLDAMAASAQTR